MVMRIVRGALISLALLAVVFYVVFGGILFGNLPSVRDAPIAPRVVQLVDGYVNVFAIDAGDGQVVLVDAGDDPTGAAILAGLSRLGHAPSAVKAILLTHGHPDHTAGARLFPEARVYAFAPDAPIAAGEKRAGGPLPRFISTPAEKTARVTDLLTDGQKIVVGTATVTAHHIPGHTGGSAAFEYEGTLFLGDSATGREDGTVVSAPWVLSDDVAQNVASLAALRDRLAAEGRAIRTLAFGHSGPRRANDAAALLAPPPLMTP